MQANNVYDLYPKPPKPNNGLWWIIAAVIIAALLTSCSTTHKSKSVSKKTVDSSSVVKTDSAGSRLTDSTSVKKDNTLTVKETEGSYTKEIIFEFATEPGKDTIKFSGHINTPLPASDYFPLIQPGRLKKITVKENGSIKQKETVAANTSDSGNKKTAETVAVNKTIETELHAIDVVKKKDIETTGYWGWLWPGLIAAAIIVVGWYFGWWPMLFAWMRRKKDQRDAGLKFDYRLPEKPKDNI